MALLLATGALHLVFENVFHAKGPFLLAVGCVWVVWIVRRWREEPGLPAAWGLTRAPLRAWMETAAFTVPVAVGLLWIGPRLGHSVPGHVWALAFLYLPWALVQEVALQGILLRGLETFVPGRAVVAVAGALFALAHLPDPVLTGLTFAVGTVWAGLFLRHRSIWPLTVSHAVLGALTYLAVLGRDPWLAIVARF